jgi:CIC family chloride channel protein
MSRIVARLRGVVEEYLSPGLLNDYIRLAAVSVAMGLVVGFSTVIIYDFYHFMYAVTEDIISVSKMFTVLLPMVGITVAYWLVTRYATTKQSGGGSHRLLESYHYEGGVMTVRDTVFEPLASSITIGMGGSAGFEGPSLLLGGGIGSLIAQWLDLDPDEIKTFLISGAAAGVAAIFKAPLTGIMFALEIPYKRDLSRRAFIPATLASISAYLVAVNFLGTGSVLPLIQRFELPSPWMLLHAFGIGIVTAVFGALFVKTFEAVKRFKEGAHLPPLFVPALGGAIVGFVGLFLPQVMGVGYETVGAIVSGESHDWSVWLLLALIFFKMLLTCVTLNSGGSGGVFVPSLFIGAALGALYIKFVPMPNEEILIAAAMASIIASANKTLLTSVAFVAETAGPSSIIFTLIAAATSYFISRDISFYEHVQPVDEFSEEEEAVHVLYHLLRKGENWEKFRVIKVTDVMVPDPVVLRENMRIKEALEAVQGCRNREYPVIRRNKIIGQTNLETLLTFPEEKQKLEIGLLPLDHPEVLTEGDSIEDALNMLMESESTCVWVVDSKDKMKLLGVVTETDVMVKLLELM